MFSEVEVTQALHNFIQTAVNQQQVSITTETLLIEAGLIDSLSIFKLLIFIEERFAVKIDPEDIVAANFSTLTALTRLVQLKLHAGLQESLP